MGVRDWDGDQVHGAIVSPRAERHVDRSPLRHHRDMISSQRNGHRLRGLEAEGEEGGEGKRGPQLAIKIGELAD